MFSAPGLPCRTIALIGIAMAMACNQPKRLNAPPQGDTDRKAETHTYFAYQADQAMLEDLSMADMHFISHTATLNGTGVARLERYAELLTESGGTLSYDTRLTNKELIEARLKLLRTSLAELVPPNTKIDVVLGPPGGRGMDAIEAISRRREMLSKDGRGRGTSGGGSQSLTLTPSSGGSSSGGGG